MIRKQDNKGPHQTQGKENNWRRTKHIAIISFDKGKTNCSQPTN